MMRSIVCQSFGVQTVPLNPPVVVTVPGRSEMASIFPLIERLDHGRLQTSQKLPSPTLSPPGLTVAPWLVVSAAGGNPSGLAAEKTFAAVNRPALSGFEGYRGFAAAL